MTQRTTTAPGTASRFDSGRMLASLLAGSALTMPVPAAAQAATWNGITSADWGTAANWDGATVPTSGTTVVIDEGGSPNQPVVSTPQSAAQTNVSAGSLTLESALTSPSLAVSGTGSLTITAAGSLVGNLQTSGAGTVASAGEIIGTVNHSGGTFTNSGSIAGLVTNTTTLVSSGTLSAGLANLSSGAGTLSGVLDGASENAGSLVVNGNLASIGTMTNSDSGTLVIDAGATWTGLTDLTNLSTAVDGVLINGSLSLAAAAGFTIGADASARVAAGGSLALDDPSLGTGTARILVSAGGQFLNQGTVSAGISSNGTVRNDGTWTGSYVGAAGSQGINSGIWNSDHGPSGFFTVRGGFDNSGQIVGNPVSVNGGSASFVNLGTVDGSTFRFESQIINGGFLDNRSDWIGNVRVGGRPATPSGGTLSNSGTVIGTVLNQSQGLLTSTGTITGGLENAGTATVRGILNGAITSTAGLLTVDGALSSNGALAISGTGRVVVAEGAVWSGLTAITNAAILENNGTLSTRIVNDSTGALSSSGTILGGLDNSGIARIRGTFNGVLNNIAGELDIGGTTVSNGPLVNSGSGTVRVAPFSSWSGLTTIDIASSAAVGMTIEGTLTHAGRMTASNILADGPAVVIDLRGGTLTIAPTGQLVVGTTTSPFGVITPGGGVVRVRGGFYENTGTLDVQGELAIGAAFGATGLLEITNGSLARVASLCLGCGNASFAGSGEILVEGQDSRFEFTTANGQRAIGNGGDGGGTGRVSIRNGGSWVQTLPSSSAMVVARGSSLLVTDPGSLLDLPAPLVAGGNLTFGNRAMATIGSLDQQDGVLQVLDGATLQQTAGSLANWSFGQQAQVLIAGEETEVTVNGALAIGSSSIGEGSGDFAVEYGATLTVLSASPSALAFGENRNLILRSGAQATMAGGLSVGRGTVLVQDASLALSGPLDMAGAFAGNTLNLFNASFSAPSIAANANAVQGNSVINLGGTETGPAGDVGSFDVAQITLEGSGAVASQLVINHRASQFEIATNFTGFGGIIRHVAGDTRFTGNQTSGSFSGETLLTGGTLRIDGTHGNTAHRLAASGGAVLGGSGRINGAASVFDATLAPGNSPGILTFGGDLILSNASLLAFELGSPGGVAGVDSDLVTVGGNLTLDGTLDIIDIGGFGPGLYRLFDYAGTLTDNGLLFGSLPGSVNVTDLEIQTAVANQVNLLVDPASAFPFWDGLDVSGNGRIDAGNGVWTATGANWTTSSGDDNGVYRPEDFLIFTAPTQIEVARTLAAVPSATAGAVEVDDAAGAVRIANGVQFAINGYTISGDALVLDATIPCGECTPLPGEVLIRVGDGSSDGADFVATIAAALIGDAGLAKTDLGTLILTGPNSYAGGTRIAAGTLQGDSTSLQGAIAIATPGTALFDQGGPGTYAGVLSGTGALIKQGTGVLALSGASAVFAGATAVTGGTLLVNGTLGDGAHRLAASDGAVLGGSGTIGGNTTLAAATLAPGTSPGTLTFAGDLTLGAASILAYELGAPGGVAGIDSDLVVVGGNLTLDGTLDITDLGGFGPGLYRLITYAGSLTDNGLALGLVPAAVSRSDLAIQTAVAQQVNLIFAAPGSPSEPTGGFTFWDGSDTAGNGRIDARNGTWTATGTNWTTAEGAANGAYRPAEFQIFGAPTSGVLTDAALTASRDPIAAAVPAASAGLVTVDDAAGAVTLANGMQFAVDGYTVTGDALGLAAPRVIVRVGDGTAQGAGFVATLATPLTGSGGLEKTDLGTLILSGANSYAGGTTVTGGTLQGNSTSLQGEIAIAGGGTVLFNQPAAGTYAGVLAGSGALRKEGAGVLALTGASPAFAGNATLAEGGIALSGRLGGTLATNAGTVLTGNGALGSLTLAGTVAPAPMSGTGPATLTLAGDLTVLAGATYRVDVAASGAADRLQVAGRAILQGGTVAISALDPERAYANGTVYRIVDAAGGLTGTFAGLTESSAFLDFTLGYDPTGAFLTTSVIAQFPDVALTYNQRQASTGLADLAQTAGSDSLAVRNAVLFLAADPARAAFDASSGEIYPTLIAARQRQGLALGQQLALRGRAAGVDGLALWGGLIGEKGHVDSDGNGARVRTDGLGGEMGLDYRGEGNLWAAGLGGGWQDGEVSLAARGSQAESDAWHVGGYARYGSSATGFTASATLVHSRATADVVRQIAFGGLSRTATARAKVRTTAALGEVRYGLGSESLAFGPLAAIEMAGSRLGAVAERGSGALDLTSAGGKDTWSRFGLGGFARYQAAGGFVDLGLRYLHGAVGAVDVDLALAGSPTVFNIRTARGSTSAVRFDASTAFALGDRWVVSGSIGATRSAAEARLDGTLRLSFRF
jgi:autotransporter-associated beta strand protein